LKITIKKEALLVVLMATKKSQIILNWQMSGTNNVFDSDESLNKRTSVLPLMSQLSKGTKVSAMMSQLNKGTSVLAMMYTRKPSILFQRVT